MSGTADDRGIEARLRGYVAEHPEAADTLRGIVMFWLGLEPTLSSLSATERALRRLEGAGLVQSRPVGVGPLLWLARRRDPPGGAG